MNKVILTGTISKIDVNWFVLVVKDETPLFIKVLGEVDSVMLGQTITINGKLKQIDYMKDSKWYTSLVVEEVSDLPLIIEGSMINNNNKETLSLES